jgi:hypothetical protein
MLLSVASWHSGLNRQIKTAPVHIGWGCRHGKVCIIQRVAVRPRAVEAFVGVAQLLTLHMAIAISTRRTVEPSLNEESAHHLTWALRFRILSRRLTMLQTLLVPGNGGSR